MEEEELEQFYMARLRRILAEQFRKIKDNQQASGNLKRRQATLMENIMECIKDYDERWETDKPFSKEEAQKKVLHYISNMTARNDEQIEAKAEFYFTVYEALKEEQERESADEPR